VVSSVKVRAVQNSLVWTDKTTAKASESSHNDHYKPPRGLPAHAHTHWLLTSSSHPSALRLCLTPVCLPSHPFLTPSHCHMTKITTPPNNTFFTEHGDGLAPVDKMRLFMCYLATHPEKLDATKKAQWARLARLEPQVWFGLGWVVELVGLSPSRGAVACWSPLTHSQLTLTPFSGHGHGVQPGLHGCGRHAAQRAGEWEQT
jgi:hypothetical protein